MCSVKNCELENFEDNKCILHCEKENIKNDEKVIKFFWKEVRKKLIKKDLKIDLTYLAFPSFEKINLNDKNELKEDSNFLYKGDSIIIDCIVDFSNSIFYSSMDFNKFEFKRNLIFDKSFIYDSLIF